MAVLTTDEWKRSRLTIERRAMERKRIRWLMLLVLIAVFGLLWYFDVPREASPVYAPVMRSGQ